MQTAIHINSELWQQFSALAQQRRERPNRLLEELVGEYLTIQNELQLDEAIRDQAGKSSYTEDDAVDLVKRFRQKRA